MPRPEHAISAAGLETAWASAADRHGRRYFTDEANHRVVVEDVAGRVWSFGQRGSGAGDLWCPRGLAVTSHGSPHATRIYVADSRNHRVQVFDGDRRPVLAFGACGGGDGQFRSPAGLAIAFPQLPFEGEHGERQPAEVLVVVDQGNARLQVFTLDGVWLATIGGSPGVRAGSLQAISSPFFFHGAVGLPRDPTRLSWQAPYLTVSGAGGKVCRIDLASAMLPGFDHWLLTAPEAERAHARRYFGLLRHGQPRLPIPFLHGVLAKAPDWRHARAH